MQACVCTFVLAAVLVLYRIDLTYSFRDVGLAAARSVYAAKLQLPNKAIPLAATAMSGAEAAASVPVPVPVPVPVLETLVQGLDRPVNSGLHINIRGKVLNLWGILSAVVLAAFAMAVFPFICLCSMTSEMTGNGKVSTLTVVMMI